jgi:Zn-dependent protease
LSVQQTRPGGEVRGVGTEFAGPLLDSLGSKRKPMNTPDIALGAIWFLAFLFSTTCHEAAHALVAKWGGDPTAFEGGQVTLNPIPHIQRAPFGMVVVPIVSYLLGGWMIGWANAPYDPSWQRRHPRRSAWMALAGPGANFGLMFLAAGVIRVGLSLGRFAPPMAMNGFSELVLSSSGQPTFLTSVLSIFFVLNLLLGTFNLLPVPPLDGHAAVMLVMNEKLALRYLDFIQQGYFGMVGLLIAWVAFDRIFDVVFFLGMRLLYLG